MSTACLQVQHGCRFINVCKHGQTQQEKGLDDPFYQDQIREI